MGRWEQLFLPATGIAPCRDSRGEGKAIMERISSNPGTVKLASDVTFFHAFEKGFYRCPSRQMILSTYESLSYASAYINARSLAWYFHTVVGLDEQSNAVVACLNHVWFPVVVAALQMCHTRLILLPGGSESSEFDNALGLFNPDLCVVDSPSHCSALEGLGYGGTIMTLSVHCDPYMQVEDAAARISVEGHAYVPEEPGDPEIVLFSSGSTGRPKAIVNRSSSYYRSGIMQGVTLHATFDDICYIPVPVSHTYGIVSMYTALQKCATIVTAVKYRSNTSLSIVSDMHATLYFGVPTMYLREMHANESGSWDLSSLRAGLVAGSSCPESVFEHYKERWDCDLVQCYGMTETAATLATASLDFPLSLRPFCVGRSIPGATFKIAEGTNEIWCKTPSLMRGIMCENGTIDPGVDEEGWLHTGDVGRLDDEGRLYITGRIKDMIIRGGINIHPSEIENLYQSNEAVAECCVVSYPDRELGERTCLCVVLARGADESAYDLRSWAKGRVEKCKIPDVVMKFDDLPRLDSGKVDKMTLKQQVVDIFERTGRRNRPSNTAVERS